MLPHVPHHAFFIRSQRTFQVPPNCLRMPFNAHMWKSITSVPPIQQPLCHVSENNNGDSMYLLPIARNDWSWPDNKDRGRDVNANKFMTNGEQLWLLQTMPNCHTLRSWPSPDVHHILPLLSPMSTTVHMGHSVIYTISLNCNHGHNGTTTDKTGEGRHVHIQRSC